MIMALHNFPSFVALALLLLFFLLFLTSTHLNLPRNLPLLILPSVCPVSVKFFDLKGGRNVVLSFFALCFPEILSIIIFSMGVLLAPIPI